MQVCECKAYAIIKANILLTGRFTGETLSMSDKKQVEFRYYDIPLGDLVFPLTGMRWNKEYGEGREKLHFHNWLRMLPVLDE